MARVNQIFTVVVATDLVIDGSNNKKVTSSTHTFVAGDVGKYISVTAGTGFTVAANLIASVTGGAAIGTNSFGTLGSTGGTFSIPQRLASTQTLGDRLFIQMKTNGSGLGYVLYSDSGAIPPSKANDADVVAELALATSTAPGGAYSDAQPGGGNFMDMSAYWVDGAVNGDKIRASYNVR
jgi:hypothetical protein